MGGAGGDEMSLGDGGALVRDAAESHRLSPMIVDPSCWSWPDVCHVTMGRCMTKPRSDCMCDAWCA
jgi:hypothetical protein